MSSSTKRKYQRRTEHERIEELQKRIGELQAKVEARKRRDLPVLKEIPKVSRRLNEFAQKALDHGRQDIANMVMAFVTSLDRVHNEDMGIQPGEDADGPGDELEPGEE